MRDSWWGVGCIQKHRTDSAAVTAQTGPHSRSARCAPAQPCLTNSVWLSLRSSIHRNWRKQKRKRKIHCPQKKQLNRRNTQASHTEACAARMHCRFRKHCLILLLIAVLLCKMQRGWIKLKWMENNWQRRPLLPLPSICLSGWQARKRIRMLVKKEAGWDDSEI